MKLYKEIFREILGELEVRPISPIGNVLPENIEIGDIHYDYSCGVCMEVRVLTFPNKNNSGIWNWISEVVSIGNKIVYILDPKYELYTSEIYDYKIYSSNITI